LTDQGSLFRHIPTFIAYWKKNLVLKTSLQLEALLSGAINTKGENRKAR